MAIRVKLYLPKSNFLVIADRDYNLGLSSSILILVLEERACVDKRRVEEICNEEEIVIVIVTEFIRHVCFFLNDVPDLAAAVCWGWKEDIVVGAPVQVMNKIVVAL